MFYFYAGYLLCMNLLALLFMYADKRLAKKKKWRIPEKTLFLVVGLGGSLGGLLGMYLFRHKTRHWYFVVGFWLMFFVHTALTVFLFYIGALQLP